MNSTKSFIDLLVIVSLIKNELIQLDDHKQSLEVKNRIREFRHVPLVSILIISADVKKLATRLMNQNDYKMKCVDYFQSLTADCRSVELEFPFFNLLFLVGYIFLLGMQVICMFKHR